MSAPGVATRCCLLLVAVFTGGCSSLHILDYHGVPEDKLDIVIVPSRHYGADPAGNPQWSADAWSIKERLLGHPMFAAYRSRINVYRLDTVPPGDFVMTRTGYWVPDRAAIRDFVSERVRFFDVEHNDQVIFLVHGPTYDSDPRRTSGVGITRGDPNILTIESTHMGAVTHEFGHAFGRLGDEYPLRLTREIVHDDANIAGDLPGNRCVDKWGDLFGAAVEAPSIFAGGGTVVQEVGCYDATREGSAANRYRPTEYACIMNQINERFPFCPVCERELRRLLSIYRR